MSDFKIKKYTVIKNAIPKELAEFAYNYLILKRKVARTLFDDNFIPPFETMLGVWNDPQVLETYSNYSDILMETLLEKVKPIMEEKTGLNLCPTYSYARIYKKSAMKDYPYNRNLILSPHNRSGGFKNNAEEFIKKMMS